MHRRKALSSSKGSTTPCTELDSHIRLGNERHQSGLTRFPSKMTSEARSASIPPKPGFRGPKLANRKTVLPYLANGEDYGCQKYLTLLPCSGHSPVATACRHQAARLPDLLEVVLNQMGERFIDTKRGGSGISLMRNSQQ